MKKMDIINNLEMDQMEYLDSLLSQLQDNVDELDDLFIKYEKSKSDNDLTLFLYEFKRLRNRQETMFNLSKRMLSEISNSVETAKRDLFKMKEVSDD